MIPMEMHSEMFESLRNNQCCGSGSGLDPDRRRKKWPTKKRPTKKNRKKLINSIFWSAGCSHLRTEGFSWSLETINKRIYCFNFSIADWVWQTTIPWVSSPAMTAVSVGGLEYKTSLFFSVAYQHWVGSPGSRSFLGMRIRIQEQGNWPKYQN